MLLTDLFTTLYRPLRLRGRSPATVRLYGCMLRAYGRYLGREPELRDLDELALARYLEARAKMVAPLSCERERNQLVALAGLAWERRLLDAKPSCPPAPIPDRVPTAWSVDELRQLMAAVSSPATWKASGEERAAFFGALVPTLYETGERIGAMLGAVMEDYDRPHLLVRAECRKGGKRDRVYRLTDATCDRIEQLIGDRTSGVIFEWKTCRGLLYKRFGEAVTAAGLDTRKRLRFHQIRRSAASHYAAAGGDAVEMLDHSSPKVTKKWYLDPRMVDRGARPCDLLPSLTAGEETAAR
jgi:integrase